MTPEDLFHQALAKSPADRPAYLAAVCNEADLRGRVEALLLAHENPGSFLAGHAQASNETVDLPASERPGMVIGSFKLLEQIGEGGFGTVFLAEQSVPVRRKVALKLLKPDMATRQVVARFEAERQALALMDHPHIAKVLDGGTTSTGRPYFVMELVKGTPITDYCDQNRLTPSQRLELFVQVCQAVQHAHQKGIIHRDLKPSNVLVSRHDTTPLVKVIDFGVAKALGQELTDKTLFTGVAQMVGTPLYMSPEQAGMSDLDVDTRSDIYSLGVLLYELLTGTTPFAKDRFKQVGYDEIRRIIREEEPPKPSTRLSTLGQATETISTGRGIEPRKLSRLLRGELDWIVMKALEKDRTRRYETATGFAADVQRYLRDEPVQACPPSVGYRFRKFARRNRKSLVSAALLGTMLLVLAGTIGWMASDRAARQARTASEVNKFLLRAESLYADNKLPEAITEVQKARGVLESGRGDEELHRRVQQWDADLDTAAKLEELRLAGYEREERERVLADYSRVFREYGIDVEGQIEEAAARVASSQIKLDLVLALTYWATQLRSDPRPRDPARWQRLVAIARAADPDPWLQRYLTANETKDLQTLRELANGADSGQFRTGILAFLGSSLTTAGDAEAAVAFLRRVQLQYPGDYLINSHLALFLQQLKRPPWDEVIAFRRAALAARPRSAWAHGTLANALQTNDRIEEAVACYRKAVDLDPSARSHTALGGALCDQKKYDEAVAASRKAIEIDGKYSSAYNSLGIALCSQKKYDEAVAAYRKATELDEKNANAYNNLGIALRDQKKYDEAVAASRKAIEIDGKHVSAYNNLGGAFHDQKKYDEAVAAYRKAIELDEKNAVAYFGLGIALCSQKKYDEAVAAYREAIEIGPASAYMHYRLGIALRDKGLLDDAIAEYRAAIRLEFEFYQAHQNLGDALLHRYRYKDVRLLDESIAAYREFVRLRKDDPAAHFCLGTVLLANLRGDGFTISRQIIERSPYWTSLQPKLAEAAACFQRAIELGQRDADTLTGLGRALRYQAKLEEAVATLQRAVDLFPARVEPRFLLGLVHSDLKRYEEAMADFAGVIELQPEHESAWQNRHTAYQGNAERALADYTKAVERAPENPVAWRYRGIAHAGLKQYDRTLADYTKAIEVRPGYATAWYYRGSWREHRRQLEKAVADYSKVIELGPTNELYYIWALRDRSRIYQNQQQWDRAIADLMTLVELDWWTTTSGFEHSLAWLLATCPDPKFRNGRSAVAFAKKYVASYPTSGAGWNTLGVAHYRDGDNRAAETALRKSMELRKGGDSFDWFFLAMALWQQGNKHEAREWYEKAIAWMIANKLLDAELIRFCAEASELLGVGVEVAPPPRVKK